MNRSLLLGLVCFNSLVFSLARTAPLNLSGSSTDDPPACIAAAVMRRWPISTTFPSPQGAQGLDETRLQTLESEYLSRIRPRAVRKNTRGSIQRGTVILYGQRLTPPYLIAIRDDTLLVNGVVADPPIVPPWNNPDRKPLLITQHDREVTCLTERIRQFHSGALAIGSPADQQRALLERLSLEPLVASAWWSANDRLHLELATHEHFSMVLSERSAPSLDEQAHRLLRLEHLSEMKAHYEENLRAGSLLVLGYGPVLTVPAEDVRSFETIVNQADNSDSTEALTRAWYHPELAREAWFAKHALGVEVRERRP
jgi:hypothetical protein